MKAVKTIGKVTLAITGCALMPVLIWVAAGTAIHQRAQKTQATPTFGQILAAGIKR